MAIFIAKLNKLFLSNEDKTRMISVEFPNDMGYGELLDKVSELKVILEKEIDKLKEQEAKKVQEPIVVEV